MPIIQIHGGETIVDDDIELLATLAQFSWRLTPQGYAITDYFPARGVRCVIPMHRMIVGYVPEKLVVDHINRVKLDNRRSNLRIVTQSMNSKNTPDRVNVSSRFRGVSRRGDKWQVVVRVNGRLKWLGTFHSESEAAALAARYFEHNQAA